MKLLSSGFRPRAGDYFFITMTDNETREIKRCYDFRPRAGDYFFIRLENATKRRELYIISVPVLGIIFLSFEDFVNYHIENCG